MRTQAGAVLMLVVASLGWAQTHRSATAKPTSAKAPTPEGPTVAIDTAMGRITCKLFSKQAPQTVANFVALAEGTKDWTDPFTGAVQHGEGFYDGIAVNGVATGILAGDRAGGGKGVAPGFPAEKTGLGYDRAGLLVMAKGESAGTTSGSLFYVLDHANLEYEKRGGTVFGVCDDASLPVVEALSHALLAVDNHPAKAVGISRIAVVREGERLPAVAAVVPPEQISPQPAPVPVATLPAPEPTGPTAVIETAKGTLTCRLFQNETPQAVANFVGLATGTKEWKHPVTHAMMRGKPFYNGLSFKRVIPDFMVQNADKPGGVGDGDLGFHFGVEQVPGLSFDRPGRLAYANSGPNTNDSEFFITENPVRRLDGLYTIFGQCDDATVKLVAAIARLPRDEKNRPLTPVVIKRITIQTPK